MSPTLFSVPLQYMITRSYSCISIIHLVKRALVYQHFNKTCRDVYKRQVLTSAIDRVYCYAFCMCNPPFFTSELELDTKIVSRSSSRPPPHNAPTGTITELVSPGGEIGFIRRIINDSMELKNQIRFVFRNFQSVLNLSLIHI